VIASLTTDGRLVENNQRLALSGHRATFRDADAQRLEKVESLFREMPFRPPRLEEVVDKTAIPANKVERIVKLLVEHDRLVAVEKNLLFHREAVDRAAEIIIDYISKEGRLESVQFKYLLDTTRKFAIPLLDYFDRIGLTRRTGNTRSLKKPPAG
jgi:selenocysteine-specific elongation factor